MYTKKGQPPAKKYPVLLKKMKNLAINFIVPFFQIKKLLKLTRLKTRWLQIHNNVIR